MDEIKIKVFFSRGRYAPIESEVVVFETRIKEVYDDAYAWCVENEVWYQNHEFMQS